MQEFHQLMDQSQLLRDQALDIEYQLINQSLVDQPAPDKNQMEEVGKLYKEANNLVSTVLGINPKNIHDSIFFKILL